MRLFILENLTCVWISCIENKSIWQNKCHRMDRAIRILGHAAAHTAGVIGKDAAHHAGIDRGGVRSDAASVRFKRVVEEPTHKSRLEADVFGVVFDAVFVPMLGDVHKNPICHRLTRETRPCRAEGHGDLVLLGKFEKGLNFTDRIRLHHRLWHESKIRGIIGVSDAVDQAGMDASTRDDLGKLHC